MRRNLISEHKNIFFLANQAFVAWENYGIRFEEAFSQETIETKYARRKDHRWRVKKYLVMLFHLKLLEIVWHK